jgi:hypothetical protein
MNDPFFKFLDAEVLLSFETIIIEDNAAYWELN